MYNVCKDFGTDISAIHHNLQNQNLGKFNLKSLKPQFSFLLSFFRESLLEVLNVVILAKAMFTLVFLYYAKLPIGKCVGYDNQYSTPKS